MELLLGTGLVRGRDDGTSGHPNCRRIHRERNAAITKGRRAKAKDVSRTGIHTYHVEQATFHVQSNNPRRRSPLNDFGGRGSRPSSPQEINHSESERSMMLLPGS